MKIIIIGAGIGGLVLACALQKRKQFNVIIYDKIDNKINAGSGMSIIGNSLFILQNLGVDIKKISESIKNICLVSEQDDILFKIPKNLDPELIKEFGSIQVNVHRADLYKELLKIYKGPKYFNKKFISYSYSTIQNRIHINFGDGSTDTCDFLIGADGIYSKVRRELNNTSDIMLNYSGFVSFRGIVDDTEMIYKNKRMIKTITSFPNNTSFVYSHIPNRLFWACDIEAPQRQIIKTENIKNYILNKAPNLSKNFKNIILNTNAKNIIQTEVCDMGIWNKKGDNNVVLIGDACCPMVHHLGQGACMAIEDAILIVYCLDKFYDKENHKKSLKKVINYFLIKKWKGYILCYISKFVGYLFTHNNFFLNGLLKLMLLWPFRLIIVYILKFFILDTNKGLRHYLKNQKI